MKIGFASDHRGYALKKQLMKELSKEYDVVDYGTYSEESTDYPDYAFVLGESVASKQVSFGVAICGSGIGISIACNKVFFSLKATILASLSILVISASSAVDTFAHLIPNTLLHAILIPIPEPHIATPNDTSLLATLSPNTNA